MPLNGKVTCYQSRTFFHLWRTHSVREEICFTDFNDICESLSQHNYSLFIILRNVSQMKSAKSQIWLASHRFPNPSLDYALKILIQFSHRCVLNLRTCQEWRVFDWLLDSSCMSLTLQRPFICFSKVNSFQKYSVAETTSVFHRSQFLEPHISNFTIAKNRWLQKLKYYFSLWLLRYCPF